MNMTRTQQGDYLDYLIQAIAKREHYSVDLQVGNLVYCSDVVEWMYCTPAWEQWEDPIEPFPADNNVKISIQWYDEGENSIEKEIDYVLQWDIDKDVDAYVAAMADFLNTLEGATFWK